MKLRTLQISALALAAVAFVLAFMTAGVALASAVLMILGLVAIGWFVVSLLRHSAGKTAKP